MSEMIKQRLLIIELIKIKGRITNNLRDELIVIEAKICLCGGSKYIR